MLNRKTMTLAALITLTLWMGGCGVSMTIAAGPKNTEFKATSNPTRQTGTGRWAGWDAGLRSD